MVQHIDQWYRLETLERDSERERLPDLCGPVLMLVADTTCQSQHFSSKTRYRLRNPPQCSTPGSHYHKGKLAPWMKPDLP